MHRRRREPVKHDIVGGMRGNELALQMGRKLGQRKPGLRQDTLHLVAVILAVGSAGEVEQAPVPGRYLHALIAVPGRQLAIARRLSNGGASPANCARKTAGPLMVFMPIPLQVHLSRSAGEVGSRSEPGEGAGREPSPSSAPPGDLTTQNGEFGSYGTPSHSAA